MPYSPPTLGKLSFDDSGGDGPAIVLVHGHPFDRTMWAPQAADLRRRGWRVIVPDLRGYGQSPVTEGRVPLEVFAGDLAALVHSLGIEQAVVAGLSMGGQIVLELYHGFPGLCRALVLADTLAPAETAEGKLRRQAAAARLEREGMAPYAEEVLPKMVCPRTIREQPAVAAHVLGMMCRAPTAGAAAALRGRAERRDYGELLSRIAVPTLVVVGREDEFTPVGDARFLHDRIKGSQFAIIDEAGHLPNLERPAEFNGVLRRFLSSVPTGSRALTGGHLLV